MSGEPILLAEMDAFDLRHAIAYGLTLGDGLRVDVIDENTLMVVGTDSVPTRGLHLATGRVIVLEKDEELWCVERASPPLQERGADGRWARSASELSDLDDDLAWVRRRSDP